MLNTYVFFSAFVNRCSSVTVRGTEYKPGFWICVGVNQHHTCSLPVFGMINQIILADTTEPNPRVFFVINVATTLGFYLNAFGYVLLESKEQLCISIGSLKVHYCFNAYQTSQGLIIKSKVDLHAFCEYL